jgi:hypothetical protein
LGSNTSILTNAANTPDIGTASAYAEDSKTAAAITLTIPAPPTGQVHYITLISASYAGAWAKKVTVEDADANMIFEYVVPTAAHLPFPNTLPMPTSKGFTVTLPAGDTAMVSTLFVQWYTR